MSLGRYILVNLNVDHVNEIQIQKGSLQWWVKGTANWVQGSDE